MEGSLEISGAVNTVTVGEEKVTLDSLSVFFSDLFVNLSKISNNSCFEFTCR